MQSEPNIHIASKPDVEEHLENLLDPYTISNPPVDLPNIDESKNSDKIDLTNSTRMLHSKNETGIPVIEGDNQTAMPDNVIIQQASIIPAKLNADEIISRISKNKEPVKYESRLEWGGYKH